MQIKPNEYRCACCEQVFEKGWTDEEAEQELKDMFGDCTPDDCDVVCDPCYKRIIGIEKADVNTVEDLDLYIRQELTKRLMIALLNKELNNGN